MQRRPTLASSCARAATAAEARFRISYPDTARDSRVIALDPDAAALVRALAGQRWRGGRFLVFDVIAPGTANGSGDGADALLLTADGRPAVLSAELDGADVAVLVATPATPADVAAVVSGACASRRMMAAGLVIGDPDEAGDVVTALRPNAMVLVRLRSSDDIAEILSALRV